MDISKVRITNENGKIVVETTIHFSTKMVKDLVEKAKTLFDGKNGTLIFVKPFFAEGIVDFRGLGDSVVLFECGASIRNVLYSSGKIICKGRLLCEECLFVDSDLEIGFGVINGDIRTKGELKSTEDLPLRCDRNIEAENISCIGNLHVGEKITVGVSCGYGYVKAKSIEAKSIAGAMEVRFEEHAFVPQGILVEKGQTASTRVFVGNRTSELLISFYAGDIKVTLTDYDIQIDDKSLARGEEGRLPFAELEQINGLFANQWGPMIQCIDRTAPRLYVADTNIDKE